MWQPYLRVVREKCSQALNILDRFHIIAKMNETLDDVRAAEYRRMAYIRAQKTSSMRSRVFSNVWVWTPSVKAVLSTTTRDSTCSRMAPMGIRF